MSSHRVAVADGSECGDGESARLDKLCAVFVVVEMGWMDPKE